MSRLLMIGGLLALAAVLPQPLLAQSIEVQQVLSSGEDNPTFLVTSPSDIADLSSRVSGLPPAPTPPWNRLGWKGFVLTNQGASGFPAQVTVLNGVVEILSVPDASPQYFRDVKDLENQLYALSASLPPMAAQRAEARVGRGETEPAPRFDTSRLPAFLIRLLALPTSGSEPAFKPGDWNKPPIQGKNNCYNYALDMMLNGFARPGRQSGKQPPKPGEAGYTCDAFKAGAVGDGLVAIDCAQACPNGSYKVALVLDTKGDAASGEPPDYHWYRQDTGGKWSHKPGGGRVTNLDTAGNTIDDPQKADRRRMTQNGRLFAGYTDFCSCFCVDKTKVMIK